MAVHGVRRFVLPSAAALFALFPSLHAQTGAPHDPPPYSSADDRDWSDEVPAHLWAVDGAATLERDGRVETAEENIALLAGDRLRTDRGRLEVLYEDGSALDVDEFSRIDLLSESLVRLLDGRIRLTIARSANTFDYRVDTVAGSVRIQTAGEYRIALSDRRTVDPELQVDVLRGSAELANAHGRTMLRAGTQGFLTERRAPSLPYAINSATWDAFDRWVEGVHSERLGTQSSRYLPNEMRYYGGAFDRYGSWDYVPDYGGYAWYPRVDVGWRPYSVGRWSFYSNFGWFWVGVGRWSWPTHHYGRWGLSSGRWYWVPDHRWAPAWVSWGGAPGYVSWCPLGFNGRPVMGFSSVRYADPWAAWTVVPARAFVPNVRVTNHIVTYQSIAPAVRSQFGVRHVSPAAPAVAPSRIPPLRAPTFTRGTAVPRNAAGNWSPRDVDRDVNRDVNRSTGASLPLRRDRSLEPSSSPSTDRLAPRTRSRIPAAEPRRVDPPRTDAPRLEAPPSVDVSRIPTPGLSLPAGPRAQPRTRVPDDLPASDAPPSRVFRSREPENTPRTEPPSPRYRSREPNAPAPSLPSRGDWMDNRRAAPERVSPPPDRGRSEPAARSRTPSSDGPRSEPSGRSRIESREPSSPPPSSARPSRSGSEGRSPSSPSSGSRGQAVRRGGGTD